MKRLVLFVCAVSGMFLFHSCEQEEIECMRVSGNIETQRRSVGDFNKVFFNDVGNLHISQGNETDVLFKGQKSVLDHLQVSVNNDELIISLDQCFNGDNYAFDIYITAPEFKQVHMAGVGNVTTTNTIVADDLTVILSGITETFDFDVETDSLSTILSGQGNITYSGAANKHKILLSGVGNINAYDLPVKKAEISVTGVGDSYVAVSENLKATLSSSGNVFYKGNPEIEKNEYSTGKLVKMN